MTLMDDNDNGDDSVLTMMIQIMTFIMINAVNLSCKLLIFLILIIKIIAFLAVLFYFYFINFARFLGGIPQHHVANYCGPVRARPQPWELRALLFTNSVWVL